MSILEDFFPEVSHQGRLLMTPRQVTTGGVEGLFTGQAIKFGMAKTAGDVGVGLKTK